MTAGLHERLGLPWDAEAPVTLIDAHHHLWDLSSHRYPWLESPDKGFFLGDPSALARNYLPLHYLADSAAHRVLATVHCEAEHDRADPLAETRWIHEQHARFGFPNAVVAHVDLTDPCCEEPLAGHRAFPLLRGIRCKPRTAPSVERREAVRGLPGSLQDAAWEHGLALLERHGLSWDLRVPYWHLEEAAGLVARFPGLTVVLNHTGLPWDRNGPGLETWRRGMDALAALPNVWVKVSELGLAGQGWSVAGNRQVVRETLELFGIGRCLFASNYPVAGLRVGYDTQVRGFVEMLDGYDAGQRDDFFWRNALRCYRIELPPA
ncbi:amidohydrolase family protein [Metapseudomonas furukawaii]